MYSKRNRNYETRRKRDFSPPKYNAGDCTKEDKEDMIELFMNAPGPDETGFVVQISGRIGLDWKYILEVSGDKFDGRDCIPGCDALNWTPRNQVAA